LIVSAGCQNDAPPFPAVDSFCAGRAGAECQQANKCPVNQDRCIEKRKSDCVLQSQSVPATRGYSPDFGEACVRKTQEVYAANVIVPSALQGLRDVCQRAYQGVGQKLGPCQETYDCAGSLVCDKSLCAALVIRQLGELCANPGEICNPENAFCVQTNGIYQCVERRKASESCTDIPCLPSLRCDGVCQEKLRAADQCTRDEQCPQDAPYCDSAVGNKCDAGLIFAPGAAACKDFGG